MKVQLHCMYREAFQAFKAFSLLGQSAWLTSSLAKETDHLLHSQTFLFRGTGIFTSSNPDKARDALTLPRTPERVW